MVPGFGGFLIFGIRRKLGFWALRSRAGKNTTTISAKGLSGSWGWAQANFSTKGSPTINSTARYTTPIMNPCRQKSLPAM